MVEEKPEKNFRTEKQAMTFSTRIIILSAVFLFAWSVFVRAERPDRLPFCIEVEPLEIGDRLFLAGTYLTVDMVWNMTDSALFFYECGRTLEQRGVFNGGFSSACTAGRDIYVLDRDRGVSLYSAVTKNGSTSISYRYYLSVPDGLRCLDITSDGTIPLCLMYHMKEKRVLIMRIADKVFAADAAYDGYRIPEQMKDSRKGLLFSWRDKKNRNIHTAVWDSAQWQRADFTHTACNEYDISSAPQLYYIETQETNSDDRIAVADLEDFAWSRGRTVHVPSPGYAEKYGRIRVLETENSGTVLVRSHYLPFGINGIDMFSRTGTGWKALYRNKPLLPFVLTAGSFSVFILTVLIAAARRWFPFLMYRNVRTVKVGSIYSRAAGYVIDSVVVMICTLLLMDKVAFQDMDASRYVYVMYIMFWITLFFYSLAVEALTGSTLGKAIAGLWLRNSIGMRCSLREILVRNVIKVFEATTLVIPLLTIVVTEQNQRLGDILAGTRVQKRGKHGI